MEQSLSLEPRVSLLDALREHLGLTGAKKGCNQGACGACTVLVDGNRVLACLSLAIQYEDRDITTIEGIAQADGIRGGFACSDRDPEFLSGSAGAVRLPI
ncbi:(2Fe-2S)-binding protein [Cupriavidus pinatubonensis]|uniref:(2Fe-2S)-binding protein n=1 Tax=Cupriavidus pinatubonensis TaxID=248026 RepID=UPI0037C0A975